MTHLSLAEDLSIKDAEENPKRHVPPYLENRDDKFKTLLKVFTHEFIE